MVFIFCLHLDCSRRNTLTYMDCTTIYVNDTTIDQLQAYFFKKIREEVHLAMMSHRKKLIKNYF